MKRELQIYQKTPPLLIILDVLAALSLVAAFCLVMFYAPVEVEMGLVQKVFYFHVAAGWTGMLGFLVATISAIACLKTGQARWDAASLAGVEIGMVFVGLCIVTGSLWARPIWNTWWTWDPRLTTALIMELVYAAYLLLRSGLDEPSRKAKFSAIYAIVGFISVPLTFLSIRIFRTIHPVIVGGSSAASGSFAMTGRMEVAFFSSLAAFTVLFAAFYWHRLRLGLLEMAHEQRRMELNTGEES